MKPSPNFIPAAVAAALIAATSTTALAQATATTDPVGFMSTTLPGSDGTNRVSRTLGIPLYRQAVYAAAVTEVAGSTLRLSGADFGILDVVTNPHILRIKSSATASHVGSFFLISSATGDQLTLSSAVASLVSVGDACEIVPANTIGSIFGTANPPMAGWVTATSATTADKLYIWNASVSTWDVYFYHSTNARWQLSGAGGGRNNTIIYPDEGVFISRIGTNPINLVSMGAIPTTAEKSELNPAGSSCIPNRFPIDIELGSTGLQLTPGWVAGTSAASADKVYIWNGVTSTWDVYFYHSGNDRWQLSGGGGSRNNTVIPAGTALFISRAGSAPAVLAQSLPYTP